jgi:hypothetical protein
MDWGMMHADQDIKRAVERLNKAIDDEVAGDPRWRTMGALGFLEQQDKSIKEYKNNPPGRPGPQVFPVGPKFSQPSSVASVQLQIQFRLRGMV